MTGRPSAAEVETVLDDIRARLRGHGGDVHVVGIDEDGAADLEFVGACNGCPAIAFTFTAVVEPALLGRAGVRSVRSRQVKSSEIIRRRLRALGAGGSAGAVAP